MSRKQKPKPLSQSTKLAGPRRKLPAIIALLLWFLISGFGYVWCRVQVVHLGYLLSKAHRQHTQLLNDNKKLHLELARLKAPERVERLAHQKLGLKRPSKDQIVVLP